MRRIMAEMYGKREGCCHGRGGSMHIFDASDAVLRRQRDRRRRTATRGRPRPRGQAARHGLRHGLLLRRRRGRRRRIPRVAESRRACGTCRCCSRARTTSTRWALRSSARSRRRTSRAKPRATAFRPSTIDGMDVLAVEAAAAGAVSAIRARLRPAAARASDLSVPRAFDVRPRALSRQSRGGALEATRPDRRARGPAASGRAARRAADVAALEAKIAPSSRTPSSSPNAARPSRSTSSGQTSTRGGPAA